MIDIDFHALYVSWFKSQRNTSHDFDDILTSREKREMRLSYLISRREEIKSEYQDYAERLKHLDENVKVHPDQGWFTEMIEKDWELPMKKLHVEFEQIKKELAGDQVESKFDRERVERAKRVDMRLLFDIVKRSGMGRYLVHCPFHGEDKHPSMVLYPGDAQNPPNYYCFTCTEGGDSVKLLMKRDGITFPQAVEKLLTLS
jgi:DNA primase